MPRKSASPAATILAYFENQPLEVAETVLALAVAAVAKRKPTLAKSATPKAPRVPKVPRATTPPAAPDVRPLGSA